MPTLESRISKAMILAAGEGTRLRALGAGIPKPMMPLAERPLLEYIVESLAGNGVGHVVINLHYRAETIRSYFGDGSRWGIHILYSDEQELLGTAGGVKAVERFFNETFLVWYGDNLCNLDAAQMAAFHRAKGGIATLALLSRADPASSGIVICDHDERIVRFVEKPSQKNIFSDLVNAGIYILEPDIFSHIPARTPCDFGHDVFPALLEAGEKLYGYRLTVPLYWIDTPADYERTQTAIADWRLR